MTSTISTPSGASDDNFDERDAFEPDYDEYDDFADLKAMKFDKDHPQDDFGRNMEELLETDFSQLEQHEAKAKEAEETEAEETEAEETEAEETEAGETGTDMKPGARDFDLLRLREFDSSDALLEAINDIAEKAGFGVTKLRTAKQKDYRYIVVGCARGGTGRLHTAKSKLQPLVRRKKIKRIVTACGCLWKATVTCRKRDDHKWRFNFNSFDDLVHNHLFSFDAAELPVHRKRKRSTEVVSKVLELSKIHGITAATISRQVSTLHPDLRLRPQDVRDILRASQRKEFGYRTPHQQFLSELRNDEGIIGLREWRKAKGHPISRIFWTYRDLVELWKKYPEVWSIDCTYCVNKYNMPLCNINGITNLGTTFNIGFCILSYEKEEDFTWLLQQLTALLDEYYIAYPFVIMTDIDQALKKAARSVLPDDIKHQVCLWHVLKNVVFNVKNKWDGSLEGTVLGESGGGIGSGLPRPDLLEEPTDPDPTDEGPTNAWLREVGRDPGGARIAVAMLEDDHRLQHLGVYGMRNPRIQQTVERLRVGLSTTPGRKFENTADGILAAFRAFIYSETEDEAIAAWKTLVLEFAEQPSIVNYLRRYYLPLREEFCTYGINSHRNFGLRASSRSESSHWMIKKLLPGRKIDLFKLHLAIKEMKGRLLDSYRSKLADQQQTRPSTTNVQLLAHTFFLVSHKALGLMEKQIQLAKDALHYGKAVVCSGRYSLQHGLPCWHKLVTVLKSDNPAIGPHLVDKHWWIQTIEVRLFSFL
jgi:hypothetical protein